MGNRAISSVVTVRSRLGATFGALERQRRRLERSPLARRVGLRRLAWWALAAVVAWTVADQVSTARATTAEWGDTVAVLVTTREVASGDVLDAHTTRVEQVPARFVPAGALDSLPVGRRVNAPLATGEMVLSSRLAAGGVGRTGATLPDGTDAVTIAAGSAAAPVRPGDVVDVLAVTVTAAADALYPTADQPSPVGSDDPVVTRRVARDALVLGVSPTAVTLAVRSDEVRPTVGAAATRALGLVITG